MRLFDFLLQQSLEGRAPKEIEVAHEVFSKDRNFDIVQDASVRVYIHRLRRKLDDIYAHAPAGADRITVPRGEYRMTISKEAPPREEAMPNGTTATILRTRRIEIPWVIIAIFAAINAVGWFAYSASRPVKPFTEAVSSRFWTPIADSGRPTFIVEGDYYIFGEAPDGLQVSRLVRDFTINSREDLDTWLMSHPDDAERYSDVDLHYLPVSTGAALRSLLPIVNAAAVRNGLQPRITTMSDLPPTMLKNANIVYVGFLSGLGLLRDPLFEASGFKVGGSYDELIDKASGRHFRSDWSVVADGKTPRRDYGYLASLPGPNGNHILIIAGTRDAAVTQAAEVAADRMQLAKLGEKAGGDGFEALYEVRTLGNVSLGSSLVLARPIDAKGIWQPDQPATQAFPDQPHPDNGE